ncbi:NTP transferase domain-containing protein [Patescibacteria group bacterium]|nr:NTP transferase domain-containing protein [Patescibacteria group bacterium]
MIKNYKRITITIKKDLLKRVDEIGAIESKNRSQVLEDLIIDSLGLHKIKTAVIMAGGEGTRLRPLTYELAKPLIPVKGKPLMEHSIDLLRKYDIKQVYISVGYKAKQIMDYFGDGSKYGMRFEYLVEKEPLGTAGPLKILKGKIQEPFMLVWCDVLVEVDLSDYMNFHFLNGGLATIALTTVEDPSRFGVAVMKGNRILNFIEKPKFGEEPSNLINAGIVILDPQVLNYLPRKKFIMIERDIYPKLAAAGRLIGYPFDGQWFDTGTYEAYEEVLKKWKGIK